MLYKTYTLDLVVLSVLIATIGAYVAVEIAQRVRAAERGRRLFWISGGALAMGLGIWSMHFVGMLALHLPVLVWYDALLLFLSFVAAVIGCGLVAGPRSNPESNHDKLRATHLAQESGGVPRHGIRGRGDALHGDGSRSLRAGPRRLASDGSRSAR